jgi:adenosylmethionine-8-amino-7-oxononanoate aminotransferase
MFNLSTSHDKLAAPLVNRKNMNSTILRDLKHIWHPCENMRDFQDFPLIEVHRAKGSYIETNAGTLIDAISSWWCKSLGHGHPKVIEAIQNQLSRFEHVMPTITTHTNLGLLGEKLSNLTGLAYTLFACDGSSAIEMAMKLAMHAQHIQGEHKRKYFLTLTRDYHGETLNTLRLCSLSSFREPYLDASSDDYFIVDIPYIQSMEDPLWGNAGAYWEKAKRLLEEIAPSLAAVIVEPLVQGASGMHCYSADFLNHLFTWAKERKIYTIADEMMTGLCRTGRWFACDYLESKPDILCIGKGLTSGTMPLSATMVSQSIYDLFYDGNHIFSHSHTYSAHALGVTAALATIEAMEMEDIPTQSHALGQYMATIFHSIAKLSGRLTNIRHFGAIVAGDIVDYESDSQKALIYKAIEKGALLRPLGKTLYWTPPLNTTHQTIDDLGQITYDVLMAL